MSLNCYLGSSVMLAGPEVGDHFTLNLYNKYSRIFFFKISSLWIFFQAVYMYSQKKKVKFLVFAKIRWVKE